MNDRSADNDGFLLIEMLVALAIIAVIGVMMSSFLSQVSAVSRLENQVAAQVKLDAASAYLKQTIEQVRPLRLLDAKPSADPVFAGSATEMRFAAVTRRGLSTPALRDIHIRAAGAADTVRLEQTMGPRRPLGGRPVPHGPAIIIIEPVSLVSFEYSDGAQWLDRWVDEATLPQAVKIRLEATAGNRTVRSTAVARIGW